MKIAVSSSGNSLTSLVEPRFGRCPYFVIIDIDTMKYEIIPNKALGSAHGAGIGAAQLLASRGVEVVLTGNVGPNAYSALSASSIKIVSGVAGTVKEAVDRLKKGELEATGGPTVRGHFGMGGRGRGRGGRGGVGR